MVAAGNQRPAFRRRQTFKECESLRYHICDEAVLVRELLVPDPEEDMTFVLKIDRFTTGVNSLLARCKFATGGRGCLTVGDE